MSRRLNSSRRLESVYIHTRSRLYKLYICKFSPWIYKLNCAGVWWVFITRKSVSSENSFLRAFCSKHLIANQYIIFILQWTLEVDQLQEVIYTAPSSAEIGRHWSKDLGGEITSALMNVERPLARHNTMMIKSRELQGWTYRCIPVSSLVYSSDREDRG